nr:aminoacyl-tRNA synthetase, class 1a, anticodon-binding [Tanacetum cinerariifolium]
MATLRYMDKHNKVGYLLKPTRSDDYHQIIDFLRASHIRFPELGPPAIQATIDKTPYTITEDLVRSRLQLADDGGIDDLPIVEIYSEMDNLGFLQAILGIETMIKRQYKGLMFSSKLFANMRLNFKGPSMPLLPAMFAHNQEGEGAGVAAQAVPQHMPTLDQPQDHLSTPSRQQTSNPNALVFEHGQSSDPNTASFYRSHKTDAGPFTNVEDDPLEGSFHMSPPRSTQAPLASQLQADHKKLFKYVVGKLVKKVKAMEVKLKTKKRKMVVSDSDQDNGRKHDVDLDALHALANAAMTVDSNIPPGGASSNHAASTGIPAVVLTGASTVTTVASTVPTGSLSVPTDVPPSVTPAGVSNKGKFPMVKEDIPVKARTFKQMQEDILEVLDFAMYYTEADCINIMAQVEANASLSKTLLGDDVSEDNFPAKMAALIKRKKQALAEKLAKERQNRPMTQAQQRTYMRQFEASHKPKSTLQELDLDADTQTFIKVISTEDSDDKAPPVWSALVGWEVISTLLEEINALYRIDQSTKHFTTLRQILYMVDRHDLGDLQVLFDSHKGGKGSCVWQHQHLWKIRSWRLYTLSNVYVLETVSSEVLYMFADVSYPLSVKLIEKMITHKLEIDTDVMGNDMATAEQLIQFIKNQLAAAQVSSA